MRVATWNINSVRIRLPLLKRLTDEHAPDVLCLQETKVEDAVFPVADIASIGYPHAYVSGQKSYNGVAILSRIPLTDIHSVNHVNAEHKRHIAAMLPGGIELHNFYVPAGGDIPDRTLNPAYGFKLDYIDAMRTWFTQNRKGDAKMVLVGDLNIAPLEHDVWSHKQLLGVVSHTPAEVERLNALQAAMQWIDTTRHFTPHEQKLYSWWSYRNRDWRKSDRGRRLDHIWSTPNLKKSLKYSLILKDARDWERGSDHVPVITEFDS